MTSRSIFIGLVLFALVIASHILLQHQLVSFVIAPLVLATWLALLPTPPEWGIIVLIICAELLSATPPGALTLAILLPLASRPLQKRIGVSFSFSFLLLTLGITFLQLCVLVLFMSFTAHSLTLPWPSTPYALFGSGVAAFLVCVIWYEFVVGYTARRR